MRNRHCRGPVLARALIAGLSLILADRVTAQTFTNLYSFTGGSDGAKPYAGLILSSNTLYGTTSAGGISGSGTVFAMGTNGSAFTTLYAWAGHNYDLAPGLTLSGNTLYGTRSGTYVLACSASGAAFKLNTDGSGYTNLHLFVSNDCPYGWTNSDGLFPQSALVLSGNTLYGTTLSGGTSTNYGTVFAVNTDGTGFTTLYSFTASSGPANTPIINSDGALPYAGLVLSGNTLYGTASAGGGSDYGTVFKLHTDGTGFTPLHSFTRGGDGADPYAGLILSGDTLYGTALGGGSSDYGTVFKLKTDGTGFTTLHSFANGDGAVYPYAGLILLGNTLYGTAYTGGPAGGGAIFAVNTDGTGFTNLYSFTGGSDGANPYAGLILSGSTLYGTTVAGGSSGNGTIFAISLAGMSFHRLGPAALIYSSQDSAETELAVTTNRSVLAAQSRLGDGSGAHFGLVADGVTPLLIKLTFPVSTFQGIDVSIASGGQLVSGSLSDHLRTPASSGWSTNRTLLQMTNGGFALLSPLKAEEITFAPGSTELKVTCAMWGDQIGVTNSFYIRKPPIVLVHGYNSDSNTWGADFLAQLTSTRPTEFVIPIQYGVTYDTVYSDAGVQFVENKGGNTSGRFDTLARELDRILLGSIENPTSNLHTNWAFTRYDIVCHSQGGVLARMLCQNVSPPFAPFASAPVRSDSNFYRGRFRRVVTIGSPHNGAVMTHYLLYLRGFGDALANTLYATGLLPEKFDPFGEQIKQINNPSSQVDANIMFNCITATIAGGSSPGFGACPYAYNLAHLCNSFVPDTNKCNVIPSGTQTIGGVLLPNGSDGVVEPESAGGGAGTRATNVYSPPGIAHSGPAWFFDVPGGQTETLFPRVAQTVTNLLDGPISQFGPFVLPTIRTDRACMDSLVSGVTIANTITPAPSPLILRIFNFTITPPPALPVAGQVQWFAERLGTNGISTDFVDLQVNTNDSTQASVTIDDAAIGTVVLYASYPTTDGSIVVSTPVVVYSSSPASPLANISILPASATLTVGDTLSTSLWGAYSNGVTCMLYTGNGQANYQSSASNVVSITAAGEVKALSTGVAAVTASFAGLTNTALITSAAPSGALQVALTPPEAVAAGAQWRVDGGAWQANGAQVLGLSAGAHTVSFSGVAGWAAPPGQTLIITSLLITNTTVAYLPLPGYEATVLAQNPIGYWRLGETNQAAMNSGSLSGAAKGTFLGGLARGEPGAIPNNPDASCRFFNPGWQITYYGSRVDVPYMAALNPNGPFTVELWAKPSSAPGNLFAPVSSLDATLNTNASRNGFLVYLDGSTNSGAGGFFNRWQFRVGGTNGSSASAIGGSFTVGTWHHVVGVYTGNGVILYVNGAQVASASVGANPFTANAAQPFRIGATTFPNRGFDGWIDEVAFYGAALSGDTIKAHFDAATTNGAAYASQILADTPLGYWRLGEAPDRAVNLGTLGSSADGAYRYGASASQPGPTPPAFPGLEASNLAVALDGSGWGYVAVPPPNLSTNALTLTCWVWPNGAQASGAGILMHRASLVPAPNDAAAGLTISASGGLGLAYNWNDNSSTYNWTSGVSLINTQWNFIALTIQSNQAAIFAPGSTNSSPVTNLVAHAPIQFSGTTYFGMDPFTNATPSARPFSGSVDEVAIFDRALSVGEVYGQYGAAVGNLAPKVFADPSSPGNPLPAGGALFLSVDAGGTPALSYQWRKNGSTIDGATQSNLGLACLGSGDAGLYDVIISNSFGAVTSQVATVSVAGSTALNIILNDGKFGFSTNGFGFSLAGCQGSVVVIEASTNLMNWVPIMTNVMGAAPIYFSDPTSSNLIRRFYRARLQ